MAATTVSINGAPANDADYRAFVTAIDSALTNGGWVHTADTGQANPATILKPGAGATDAGYIIYGMSDSLQTSRPCYMKITYGSGTTATITRLKIQISSATDLAGNCSGVTSSIRTMTTSNPGITSNCYFSVTTSRAGVCLWPTSGSQAVIFVVERDRDNNGIETSDGFSLVTFGATTLSVGSGCTVQFIGTYSAGIIETKLTTLISSQTSQSANGITGVGVVRPVYGAMRNPMLSLLSCSVADFTTEITNSISLYGVSHIYMPFTSLNVWSSGAIGNNSAPGIHMLYE